MLTLYRVFGLFKENDDISTATKYRALELVALKSPSAAGAVESAAAAAERTMPDNRQREIAWRRFIALKQYVLTTMVLISLLTMPISTTLTGIQLINSLEHTLKLRHQSHCSCARLSCGVTSSCRPSLEPSLFAKQM